ncbi:hypothetical protein EWM64_g2809 [Hericium alpestre]|uniref:UBZ4-type domain-containing protein n=1 Tax=Hericium alpestre TaxID=135208 RepID=A0A4Z0A2C4_9AGAM|nr:hypothetical protein EWM64_g2809 [Hericium alpestre]
MPPLVTCPVCSHQIAERDINQHLDANCQLPIPSASSASSSQVFKPVASIFQSPRTPSASQAPPPRPSTSKSSSKKRAPSDTSAANTPLKRSKASTSISSRLEHAAPLAERLRPKFLEDFVGHSHITGPESPLLNLVQSGATGSIIFWGPPGCGKTTLARLLAKCTSSVFKELSATIAGINDVRPIFEEAKNVLQLTGRRTILFLDEVHRFSKSQQDIFLPFLEQGRIQVGATTENPSFKLNSALLSRCRVFVLERLTDHDIEEIVWKAVARVSSDLPKGGKVDTAEIQAIQTEMYSSPTSSQSSEAHSLQSSPCGSYPQLTPSVVASIVSLSTGDARTALSLLELVLASSPNTHEATLLSCLRSSVSTSYDRSGDSRYDLISALHKSVRGSQGSAALYWLARMLEAGEDPLYIARRMVVCASEDIGLADNQALPLAIATLQACQLIGMPECRINLAHLVSYLSEAPKSTRAYEGYNRAVAAAKSNMTAPVPLQVRNAPTKLMKELGYAKDYCYNPSYAHPVTNEYLPTELKEERFLRREGDMHDKAWDEDALKEWEKEENEGREWEGRRLDMKRSDDALRVLLTGYGPFFRYRENASWLAVKPLNNTYLKLDPSATSDLMVEDDISDSEIPNGHADHHATNLPQLIHITSLQLPLTYEAVLDIVPGFHARPPVLPLSTDPIHLLADPPEHGYDFIFHVGLAGRGPLRMERLSHKIGYRMKDTVSEYAPVVDYLPEAVPTGHEVSQTEMLENARLLEHARMSVTAAINEASSPVDMTIEAPVRGFGKGYEGFPEDFYTLIDVERLVHDLKETGFENIYSSLDSGHYVCDFTYYCSLAEAKRTATKHDRGKHTKVLFMHCPPVEQPFSTEEVVEAVQKIILWIRRKLVIVGDAIFENYVAEIRLDGKPVQLALWDTAGQEEYERLRPLSYSKSHVILIAYAIDTTDSLENVTVKWIEEVRSICGSVIPIILVGCKADLRPPPGAPNAGDFVTRAQAERVAQIIGARAYKECSALKIEGVDDVFEAATRASMLMREGVPAGGMQQRRRSSISGDQEDSGRGLKCCVIC